MTQSQTFDRIAQRDYEDLLTSAARHEHRQDHAAALNSLEQAYDAAPPILWPLIGVEISRVKALDLEQRKSQLRGLNKLRWMFFGGFA